MSEARQLHLNTNITHVGRHPAAWRTLEDPTSWYDVAFYRNIARIAERGTLDALFLSDGVALRSTFERISQQALEPTVLLTALAAGTERIGLVGTASTTFNDPYNLARRFASVDHISGGRVAWNVVTTYDPASAANFGLDHIPDHAERYARAAEFVDAVVKLWDSWEDDAVVGDRATGILVDGSRVHAVEHRGRHLSVRGPLTLPRAPQGRPVLVQAGSSEEGRDLAGRFGEVIFTSQTTLSGAKAFAADIRRRAVGHGRDPDHVLLFPGLYPVLGGTEAEAWRRKAEMDAFLDLDEELGHFALKLGVDPSDLSLDRPLPYERIEAAHLLTGSRGFVDSTLQLARANDYTVRDLLARNPGAHRIAVGTPEQIADDMELWFREGAADGFNLNADAFPSGLEAVVDHVVPELRRRGIFRTEYTGTTLREHLGLPRPASQYAPVAVS